jgi:hypothetical protein
VASVVNDKNAGAIWTQIWKLCEKLCRRASRKEGLGIVSQFVAVWSSFMGFQASRVMAKEPRRTRIG